MDNNNRVLVLAIDSSGSTHSWKYIAAMRKKSEELLARYQSVRIFLWNDSCKEISKIKLMSYMSNWRPSGTTCPHTIFKMLCNFNEEYDIVIITDGEIPKSLYSTYLHEYNRLARKPTLAHIDFIGCPRNMSMQFVDCFNNGTYSMYDTEADEQIFSNFEIAGTKEDFSKFIENMKELKELDLTDATSMKAFYTVLSNYHKSLSKQRFEEILPELKRLLDTINVQFREIVNATVEDEKSVLTTPMFVTDKTNLEERLSKMNSVIERLKAGQFVNKDRAKIMTSIMNLCNGHATNRTLQAYKRDIAALTAESGNVDVELINKSILHEDKELDESATLLVDNVTFEDQSEYGRYTVLMLKANAQPLTYKPEKASHRLQNNPFDILMFISSSWCSQIMLPNNQVLGLLTLVNLLKSAESPATLNDIVSDFNNLREFKSPFHAIPVNYIILSNPKYLREDLKENEEKLVRIYNVKSICNILFGSQEFVGNRILLCISFLGHLYNNLGEVIHDIDTFKPLCECLLETMHLLAISNTCRILILPELTPNISCNILNSFYFHLKSLKLDANENILKHSYNPQEVYKIMLTLTNTYPDDYEQKVKYFSIVAFINYVYKRPNYTAQDRMSYLMMLLLSLKQNFKSYKHSKFGFALVEGGVSTKSVLVRSLIDGEYKFEMRTMPRYPHPIMNVLDAEEFHGLCSYLVHSIVYSNNLVKIPLDFVIPTFTRNNYWEQKCVPIIAEVWQSIVYDKIKTYPHLPKIPCEKILKPCLNTKKLPKNCAITKLPSQDCFRRVHPSQTLFGYPPTRGMCMWRYIMGKYETKKNKSMYEMLGEIYERSPFTVFSGDDEGYIQYIIDTLNSFTFNDPPLPPAENSACTCRNCVIDEDTLAGLRKEYDLAISKIKEMGILTD